MTFKEWAEPEFIASLDPPTLTMYEDTWIAAQASVDVQEMVGEFHQAMRLPSRRVPEQKTPKFADEYDRLDYLLEELHEFSRALRYRDFPEAVDALADLIYFAYGTADRWGVDLRPIIAAVHETNMKKKHDVMEAGKITKPPGWIPPDVKALLIEQGWTPPIQCVADGCDGCACGEWPDSEFRECRHCVYHGKAE